MKNRMLPAVAVCVLLVGTAFGQTKPVTVQEVDIPEKRAFQVMYSLPDLSGRPNTIAAVLPTRRWVIEQVSIECRTTPGYLVHGVKLYTTVMGVAAQHILPLTPQGSVDGLQMFAGVYPVKLYADGGTPLQVSARVNHTNGGQCVVSISGYWLELLALHF